MVLQRMVTVRPTAFLYSQFRVFSMHLAQSSLLMYGLFCFAFLASLLLSVPRACFANGIARFDPSWIRVTVKP